MAKKYIQDAILANASGDASVITAALSATIAALFEHESDRWENEPVPIFANIEAETAQENGENVINWAVGQDENGGIIFNISDETAPAFTENAIAVVAIWADEAQGVIDQPDSEPLKRLQGLYILALPTISAMRNNAKLREHMDSLLARDLLGKARSIARKLASGADGFTLVADPVGMFLAATTKAASRETAYNRMWTFLQAVMLQVAEKGVAALKLKGDHANAGVVRATFSRGRLSKTTLKACLASHSTAAHYFPSMVVEGVAQEDGSTSEATSPQWDNLLKMMIARAPKHQVRKLAKDAAGEKVLDAEGKNTYDTVPAAQSPAIFSYWLENRYAAQEEVEETTITLDFGSIDL